MTGQRTSAEGDMRHSRHDAELLMGAVIAKRRGTAFKGIWDVVARDGTIAGTIMYNATDRRWAYRVGRTDIFTDPNRLAVMAKITALGAIREHLMMAA